MCRAFRPTGVLDLLLDVFVYIPRISLIMAAALGPSATQMPYSIKPGAPFSARGAPRLDF